MSVRYDVTTGSVRAYGAGIWSVRQAAAYFRDWRDIVRAIHARGLSLSALIDMGDGQVQSDEVAEIMANITADMYRPGDAIAMRVPSSLAKMQLRRILDARYHEFFMSPAAAETWLKGKAISAAG